MVGFLFVTRSTDDFFLCIGEIGRVAETGINQFINNEINSKMTPGALDGGGQGEAKEKFW
jgi:hypothetical protein